MLEPRGDKTCAQLAETQAALQKLAKELLETRAQSAAQQQQVQSLLANERASGSALTALETRLKHVGGMAEEHGRYLSQIGEALFAKNAVAHRFRTAAVVPSFAPPPPGSGAALGLGLGLVLTLTLTLALTLTLTLTPTKARRCGRARRRWRRRSSPPASAPTLRVVWRCCSSRARPTMARAYHV